MNDDKLLVLEIKRDKTDVIITIPNADEYAAMMLYDQIRSEAAHGAICLTLHAERKQK